MLTTFPFSVSTKANSSFRDPSLPLFSLLNALKSGGYANLNDLIYV